MKILLFQTSNTQRVTATKNADGSWLLSKEWRRNSDDIWTQGKGFTVPQKYVFTVGQVLESNGSESVIAKHGLECLKENEGVEKSDFRSKKSANSWDKTHAHYRKQNTVGNGV